MILRGVHLSLVITAELARRQRHVVVPIQGSLSSGLLILPRSSRRTVCTLLENMPSPPYAYRLSEDEPQVTLDLSSLAGTLNKSNDKRQTAFEQSRKLHVALVKARNSLECNTATQASSELKELLLSSIAQTPSSPSTTRVPREANLSSRVEEYVRFNAFNHFLETGKLIPPSDCEYATDEEYLAGACMSLCQDLSRYSQGRAIERDVESVTSARNLVRGILDYLMEFDFRNGPLRRKYDGTKYALKAIETILYELSVTGSDTTVASSSDPSSSQEDHDRLPQNELLEIRRRMEHRDNLRETLIKKCRDGQKAAKQVSALSFTREFNHLWCKRYARFLIHLLSCFSFQNV